MILLKIGLKLKDKLLIKLGNIIDFPVPSLAAIASGIVPIPISAELTKKETENVVEIVKPKMILVELSALKQKINEKRLILFDDLIKKNSCPANFNFFKSKKPISIYNIHLWQFEIACWS